MAAHRATVNVSATVLPDEIKTTISGVAIYDLNDIGDNNRWVYWANNVSTGANSIIPDGVGYIPGTAGDVIKVTDEDVDDLGFILIKHSGYSGDGTTVSTDNLYLNTVHGVSADAGAEGDMILKPGELWWGRFANSDLSDISVEAAANEIKVLIWAICDDGGV